MFVQKEQLTASLRVSLRMYVYIFMSVCVSVCVCKYAGAYVYLYNTRQVTPPGRCLVSGGQMRETPGTRPGPSIRVPIPPRALHRHCRRLYNVVCYIIYVRI